MVYPEFEKYQARRREIDNAYDRAWGGKHAATRKEEAADPDSRRAIWGRFYGVEERLMEKRDAERETARTQLADDFEASGEKLGAWTVRSEYFTDYSSEVEDLLENLPADENRLHELRRRFAWCNAFDRFLRAAKAAGVVELAPLTVDSAWTAWRGYAGPSDRHVELVKDIVRAELAAHGVTSD